MQIGNGTPRRTNKTVVRSLFPETAIQPQRKVKGDDLFTTNPPDTRRQNPFVDINQIQSAEDLYEDKDDSGFSLVQNNMRPKSLDEPAAPAPVTDQSDPDVADFGAMKKHILDAVPVVDKKDSKAPDFFVGKKRQPTYTSAELAELGLKKD